MYVGYQESKEAIKQGKKVNFFHNGQKVVLDKNSTMEDLYRVFGLYSFRVRDLTEGKFSII